jgi:hypothetical protein
VAGVGAPGDIAGMQGSSANEYCQPRVGPLAVARRGAATTLAPQPTLRVRLLGRIGFAVRQPRRMALAIGLALTLLAASVLLYSTPPDKPLRVDKPTVATQLVPRARSSPDPPSASRMLNRSGASDVCTGHPSDSPRHSTSSDEMARRTAGRPCL